LHELRSALSNSNTKLHTPSHSSKTKPPQEDPPHDMTVVEEVDRSVHSEVVHDVEVKEEEVLVEEVVEEEVKQEKVE
jgi:hypothetical protein